MAAVDDENQCAVPAGGWATRRRVLFCPPFHLINPPIPIHHYRHHHPTSVPVSHSHSYAPRETNHQRFSLLDLTSVSSGAGREHTRRAVRLVAATPSPCRLMGLPGTQTFFHFEPADPSIPTATGPRATVLDSWPKVHRTCMVNGPRESAPSM